MLNGVLDNFLLPEVATDAIRRQGGLQETRLDDGVTRFAGHDKGVAFRFFNHQEYNEAKTKILKYPKYDSIDMIEWLVDRRTKPVERVRFLPAELLRFDVDHEYDDKGNITKTIYGECIGGRYMEAYTRYKQGLSAPGLALSKWGVLGDGEVATLAHNGIFSVEQFAALPRGKIEGRYPQEIVDGFEKAIQYVNSKVNRDNDDKHAEQVLDLQRQLAKQADEMASLRRLLEGNQPEVEAPKAKRGKTKKGAEVESE